MCTLFAAVSPHLLLLAGNRDESFARPPARLPFAAEVDGVGVLWPQDPQGGGTWTAVTTRGLAFSLLNDYGSPWTPPAPARSRGLLIPALASAASLEEVEERLRSHALQRDLPRTAAFHLHVAAFDAQRGLRAAWRGDGLHLTPWSLPGFAASSGYDEARAAASRGALLRPLLTGAPPSPEEVLTAFTAHDADRPGPWGVCMHGPLSRTVSHTQLLVTSAEITLRYLDGQPCQTPAWTSCLTLPRTPR